MFPGINSKYGILQYKPSSDGVEWFNLEPTEPIPIESDIWEPVKPLQPATLSFEFDVDEMTITDLINDRIALISATGIKFMDGLGNVFESSIIQVLEKPKHRVKKGKKYIWKYKNSDTIWFQGINKKGK